MRLAKVDRLLAAAGALLIACYYWTFTHVSLATGFSFDDLMNLTFAWQQPFSDIVKANLFFRTEVIRPFGQLFYASFYQWFGMDAAPYRVFCYTVLWINVGLAYLALREMARSPAIAGTAVLLHCCQPNFFPLYYGSGNCYDVFSFFFYFASLAFVLRARAQGRLLATWECAVVAVLFACAVNSKEAAASLPVVLLVYELTVERPRSWNWIWNQGRAVLVTGAVGLLFLWARFTGPNNLLNHPAYRPVFNLRRYLESTAGYLNELVCMSDWWTPTRAAILLGSMVLVAAISRSRNLVLATAIVILGAAPVAFVPPRGIASYYIPLTGYALFFATLCIWAAGRRLRARILIFVVLYGLAWRWQITRKRELPDYPKELAAIESTVADFRSHPEWFQANSTLLIVNDCFPGNEWASTFLADLVGNQHAMTVHTLVKLDPKPTRAQIESYTHVIGFRDGRYVELDRSALPSP